MTIRKKTEYKEVEVLAFDFLKMEVEEEHDQVDFRYRKVRSQLTILENRMAEVEEMLKVKN